MMSLTALLLRIIPPLIKGYPSYIPRRSKPWLKSKFEEQKLKPMIMPLNCYDVWLLREVGHDGVDQPENGSECMTDSTCFKSFSIYRFILSVTRMRGRFKDRNLLAPAKRWWKGVPVYL
uniref:Uncharacterized protein n=1 Tax=Gossypium raimondii TaxID=29730 RepID=A0A0D2T684_GOSRA|nr:hypothetical protein B456_007G024500 [Gossypium raimondii]